jgi:hypothetical protein
VKIHPVPPDRSRSHPLPNPMPRHQDGELFLKGPLDYDWWSRVASLRGPALHVASHLKQRAGWQRSFNRRFNANDLNEVGLRRTAALDGLALLESAGLAVVGRAEGRKSVVELVIPDTMARERAVVGSGQRSLKLPIPWGWWTRAAKSPGPALPVALALWFQAGWLGNEATFPFAASDWTDFGLTRYMVGDGLAALLSDDLVDLDRSSGRPTIVTVREAPPALLR